MKKRRTALMENRFVRELERFRHRRFLEASMAACALISMADRKVSLSEQVALDDCLEQVAELRVFDPHKAVDLHRSFVDGIRRNPVIGKRRALAALSRFARDSSAAALLVRLSVAIASAGGAFTDAEREALAEICGALGVSQAEASPWVEAIG